MGLTAWEIWTAGVYWKRKHNLGERRVGLGSFLFGEDEDGFVAGRQAAPKLIVVFCCCWTGPVAGEPQCCCCSSRERGASTWKLPHDAASISVAALQFALDQWQPWTRCLAPRAGRPTETHFRAPPSPPPPLSLAHFWNPEFPFSSSPSPRPLFIWSLLILFFSARSALPTACPDQWLTETR